MSRSLPGTRLLRTFEAAARHLNFTRAAHEVGLTPAAVSYRIKEMEAQLGLALFVRSSRSIELTPAGRVLFEAVADVLDNLQRATARARRMQRGEGHLRVSLGARFATHWLLPRLERFRTAHPDLELTFDISDQVRDFAVDDVDVAIRFGAGHYENTCAERLFDSVVVPVCSPRLLATERRLSEPRDLLGETLCHVDCEVNGLVWPNWSMWMVAAGVDGFDASRSVAFGDSSHVVQAVVDGNAIGLVELSMVARDLVEGRLVRLFDIGISLAPKYAYYLVYPQGMGADPRICALREWMFEEIAGGGGARFS
ncbi:transcriptional regulator GcvA [Pseudomonas citronellolis]|uniref:transcriptional regulator GcvA n=1 Tax=Pseudomonas citronellolis TaxID=53408 RepID=UPI000853523B|nr:transcriptional regulator GcvA [Pseudomonas humi]